MRSFGKWSKRVPHRTKQTNYPPPKHLSSLMRYLPSPLFAISSSAHCLKSKDRILHFFPPLGLYHPTPPLCTAFLRPKEKEKPTVFFRCQPKKKKGSRPICTWAEKTRRESFFAPPTFSPGIPQFRIILARSTIPLSPSSPKLFVVLLPSIKRKPVASRRRRNNKPHCLFRVRCVDPPSRE